MDETITLRLPPLFAAQILCLLHEVHIALSSRQSYVPGEHLTPTEVLKMTKYYQEIIDVVGRQYYGNRKPSGS